MALKTHLPPPPLQTMTREPVALVFKQAARRGGVMHLFGRHRVMKRIIPL